MTEVHWAVSVRYLKDSQEYLDIGAFVGDTKDLEEYSKKARAVEDLGYFTNPGNDSIECAIESIAVTKLNKTGYEVLMAVLEGSQTPNFPLELLLSEDEGLEEEEEFNVQM